MRGWSGVAGLAGNGLGGGGDWRGALSEDAGWGAAVGGGGDGGAGPGGGGGGVKRRKVAVELVLGRQDGLNVAGFGDGGWAFDGGELERADLGEDVDQAGKQVGAGAGLLTVGLPVILLSDDRELAGEALEVGVSGDVRGFVFAVQDRDRVGDAGKESDARRSGSRRR